MIRVFHEKKVHAMLHLVKHHHIKQFRNNGKVPYWHHCLSVAEIIANALTRSQELKSNNNLLTTIVCGALGHDLFEDTNIKRKIVAKQFGKQIKELIAWLTNEENDTHREKYMEKIKASPEEVALIKYADLIENTISCAYSINNLGIDWIKKFYRPIKNDTKKVLCSKRFVLYPKTVARLREQFAFAEERFDHNLTKY